MANGLTPTAANIISSLGIKGAIGKIPAGAEGSSFHGFVPFLNEDGKVDLTFIPAGAAAMSVKMLHNVAVVDPGTEETIRTGSVIAPFKTLAEAAASIVADEGYDYATRCALLLMPGKYNDTVVEFSATPLNAFVICFGECLLGRSTVAFTGMKNGGNLTLCNITTDGNISVTNCSTVTCLGMTRIIGMLTVADGASLRLSAESFVASTSAVSISYLTDSSRVGNTSQVEGVTVGEALDTLGNREIRVADLTADSDGFHYENDRFIDIKAVKIGNREIYDLRGIDKTFVDGINHLVLLWKNPVVGTLTADKVKAKSIEAESIKVNSITFGGYKLAIDSYGYLVILDEGEPVSPVSGVILIKDSVNGNVYVLGIADGRMYVSLDDESSEIQDVVNSVSVIDPVTGISYSVTMRNGRLFLSSSDGSGEDSGAGETHRSNLYAMDESSGRMYRVVAVKDPETNEVTLGVDQAGVESVVQ